MHKRLSRCALSGVSATHQTQFRSVATAVKTAVRPLASICIHHRSNHLQPRPLGKWAAPEPTTFLDAPSPLPGLNKWASPNNRVPSSSRTTAPDTNKWKRGPHCQDDRRTSTQPSTSNTPTRLRRDTAPHFSPLSERLHRRPEAQVGSIEDRERSREPVKPLTPRQPQLDGFKNKSSGIAEPATESRKRMKSQFKSRGSLIGLAGDNTPGIPAYHGKSSSTREELSKMKKKKAKVQFIRVKNDVFLPSIISVGNLARLLQVPLSTFEPGLFSLTKYFTT
jgi:hypothetical protein